MILRHIGEISPGIHRYALNLARLYPDPQSRDEFERRWKLFADSTPDHHGLFSRDDDWLVYPTESFLTQTPDGRIPVLLVLGNPASQSVRAGMCFAFERGSTQEHRFWRALRLAGWLSFNDADMTDADASTRNTRRRGQLIGGKYESPFRIGIDVFFTFPSPASAPRWSGVAGLTALFGRKGLRLIADAERARIADTIARYMPHEGAVVAFQKDAYEGLRQNSAPAYAAAAARAGELFSDSAADTSVSLFGAPPTRLAHTHIFQAVLRTYSASIMKSRSELVE
jgi:hypothetical protein